MRDTGVSSAADLVRCSSDDTNIGAIVGGAVGGGVGLVCLLLLLLALVVLVLARRRNGRRQMRKLTQPNYAELAYGDVDNVSLPKRKAEARPPSAPAPLLTSPLTYHSANEHSNSNTKSWRSCCWPRTAALLRPCSSASPRRTRRRFFDPHRVSTTRHWVSTHTSLGRCDCERWPRR